MKSRPEKIAFADPAVDRKMAAINRRFLYSISWIMLIMATVGVFISLLRIPATGLHFNHLVHMAVSAVVIAMHFLRKRLSQNQLALYIALVCTGVSISALLQYGIVSGGLFFATMCLFVVGLTWGLRGGILCTLFYALVVTLVGWLWMSGRITFPGNVEEYILKPSVWLNLGSAYLITAAVFYVSASGYVGGLRELIGTIDRQKKEIQARTEELGRAKRELEQALNRIETLDGLLPICSKCKKIRNDKGYWEQVEVYVRQHTKAEFTHSMCPECMREMYPDFADKVLDRLEADKE